MPRPLAFASLLMIAVAFAQSSAAAELQSSMPAPRPEPPPADRDLVAVDFEALLRSYASVTHLADGRTMKSPASDTLRALLEEEYAEGNI